MKAKNILMTLLLVTGAIAAKAAGYPPELALVSQPVMVYNHSSITVYYDVENIGDYTYRGNVCLYLYPDEGYSYAEKWVKVRPGHIKRIAVKIPAYRIRKGHPFTIMPYYEMGDELYSFTTFEYFEPITFFWEGPRNEHWVVINIGPCPRYYHRPGSYRYYYDGFRPPMPPAGHEPRPMDPMHHTYGYHHNNGGYPAHSHHEGTPPPASGNNHNEAPSATARPGTGTSSMSSSSSTSRPKTNTSSMSSTSSSRPSSASSSSTSGSSSRPKANTGASSGRTPASGTSTSSATSRPKSSSSSSVRNSGNNSRPSSTESSSSVRSGSSSSSRSNGTSTSTTTRSSSSKSSSTSARSNSSSRSTSGTSRRG